MTLGFLTRSPDWLNLVQRCDGMRPCVTCALSKSALECTYRHGGGDSPRGGIIPSRSVDGLPSGQHLRSVGPVKIPMVTSTYPPAQLDPTPFTYDTERMVAHEPPIL